LDLVRILTELERRTNRNRLIAYRPYERQREFHEAGRAHRERLFMAGNQLGKTWAGGFECAMHLTGRYPDWWGGRRYDRPVRLWAAGVTGESTRDNPQRILLGPPPLREQWGTGTVPGDSIEHISLSRGIADAVDSIVVRHASGGPSTLTFKAYGMGREKWQIGSCATGDECSWSKRIVVTDSDQLSRPTKEQIVAHNRKVSAFCRR
jgi:phage terminase large subunit-like protein